MANVPLSKDVPKIYVPSLSNPQIYAPQLKTPQIEVPGKVDFKLPERRHVKDLGDIILGSMRGGTKQLRHTLEDNNLSALNNSVILNRLTGIVLLHKERYLEPIKDYGWDKGLKIAGVNALETMASSSNLLSNPVKSLCSFAGGGSSTDLLKSMGWLENEYREYYNVDTGNFIADIVLETITDPVTWLSLGSSIAMTGEQQTIKALTETVYKNISEETQEHISKEYVEYLVKRIAKETGDSNSKIVSDVFSELAAQRNIADSKLTKVNLGSKEYIRNKKLLETLPNLSVKQQQQVLQAVVDADISKGYAWYTAASNLKTTSDNIRKAINYASLGLTPVGSSMLITKYMVKPLFKAAYNTMLEHMKTFDFKTQDNLNTAIMKREQQKLSMHIKGMYKKQIDNFDAFCKANNIKNIDFDKLSNIYTQVLMSNRGSEDIIDALFVEEMFKRIPKLYSYYEKNAPEVLDLLHNVKDSKEVQDLLYTISKQLQFDLPELVEAVAADSLIAKQAVSNLFMSSKEQQLETVFSLIWNNTKQDKNIAITNQAVELLNFVKETTTNNNSSLNNIFNLLPELQKTNPKLAEELILYLNYLGINPNNIKRTSTLLKYINRAINLNDIIKANPNITTAQISKIIKQSEEASKELESILYQGQLGKFYKGTTSSIKDTAKLSKALSSIDNAIDTTDLKDGAVNPNNLSFNFFNENKVGKLLNSNTSLDKKVKEDWKLFQKLTTDFQRSYKDLGEENLQSIIEELKFFNYYAAAPDSKLYKIFDPNYYEGLTFDEYVADLMELREQISKLANQIKKADINNQLVFKVGAGGVEKALSQQAQKFVLNLDNYLNNNLDENFIERIPKLKDTVADALRTGSDIYKMKTSQLGIYELQRDNEFRLNIDSKYSKMLHDPKSKLRENMLKIADKLEVNPELKEVSSIIRKIFATFDANKNLDNLLHYTFYSEYTDPIINDYIAKELFQRIYKFGDVSVTRINDEFIDELVKKAMANIRNHMDLDIPNYLIKQGVTQPEYMETVYKEIEESIRENLKSYVAVQQDICKNLGVDVKLYQSWSTKAIANNEDTALSKMVNQLGFNYENVLEYLATLKTEPELIEDTNTFFRITSTDFGRIDNIKKMLAKYYDSKELDFNSLETAFDFNLSRELINAHNNVAKQNGWLQGKINSKDLEEVNKITNYFIKDDFYGLLNAAGKQMNLYEYSVSSGGLGFKTEFKNEDIISLKLNPLNFLPVNDRTYNATIYNVNQALQDIRDYAVEYTDEYIENLKDNLINFYSNRVVSDTILIPRDAREFFTTMNADAVLAWDRATSKIDSNRLHNIYNKIKYKYSTFNELTDKHVDPFIARDFLDELGDNKTYEDIANAVESVEENKRSILHDYVTEDLKTNLKDAESLKNYRKDLSNWQMHNVDAYNNLRALDNMFTGEKDILQKQMQVHYERTQNVWESFKSWDAEHIRIKTDENHGILFIKTPKNDEFNLLNKFTQEELDAAGLKICSSDKHPGMYIILSKDNNIKHGALEYIIHESNFPEAQAIVTDVLDKNKIFFDYSNNSIPLELYDGTVLNRTDAKKILESELAQDILDDEAKQILYSKTNKLGYLNFFENDKPILGTGFIGDLDCYQSFLDTSRSTSLANNVYNSNVYAIKAADARNKMVSLFFNDDYALNGSVMKPIFDEASDKEIKELFARYNYVATVVKDNHGKPKVYKIIVENKKDLQKAMQQNAVLLTQEMYRTLVLGINRNKDVSAFSKLYKALIDNTFKSLWLSTPGFLIRNYIDSELYKKNASTGGISSIWENMEYQYKARKMLDWYDTINRDAIQMRFEAEGISTPNKDWLHKAMLKHNLTNQQRAQFLLIKNFEDSGASGGLTKAVQEALKEYNETNNISDNTWIQAINDAIYNTPVVKQISNANEIIERTSRFSQFLYLYDHGLDEYSAIKNVLDTHFDYALDKTKLGLLGDIFWFLTFPLENSLYYLDYGLTKNPEVLDLILDITEISWNSEGMTWDKVRQSDFLMYNALAGHVRFNFDGKQIVLKTGFSVFDFFNTVSDPVGTLKEHLNPLLSVLVTKDINELNPISSNINRAKQIMSGYSLVPSVYTTLKEYKQTPRIKLERIPYIKKGTWYFKKPKKSYFKKPDNMKRMKYKFSTSRYYFNHGKVLHKNLFSGLSSIEPYWYHQNYRLNREIRKTRRFKKSNVRTNWY